MPAHTAPGGSEPLRQGLSGLDWTRPCKSESTEHSKKVAAPKVQKILYVPTSEARLQIYEVMHVKKPARCLHVLCGHPTGDPGGTWLPGASRGRLPVSVPPHPDDSAI